MRRESIESFKERVKTMQKAAKDLLEMTNTPDPNIDELIKEQEKELSALLRSRAVFLNWLFRLC